ncbi:MAG: hypothetical protein N2Z80_02735 [Hydrogenothermaceae bacterium]|nr:hypothetical protein [Hydrogenothermaceae bacterium]
MTVKYIYTSMLVETASFFFFLNTHSLAGITSILTLHSIGLVLLLIPLLSLVPKRFKKDLKKTSLALFMLCFFTLYLGYISLLVLTVYLLRKQRNLEFKPFKFFSIGDLLDEDIQFSGRRFGEGSIFAVSKAEDGSKILKERAILFASDIKSSLTINILKESLSSKYDDIRLYAFSVVSKIEKEFNENLHRLKEEIKKKNLTDQERSELLYNIASQYYDFVYFNIVDEEFREFFIEESFYYAKKSLESYETPEALILLGKIYLKRNMPEMALPYFISASKYENLNPLKYVPYIAEIYYRSGLYRDIVEIVNKYPQLKSIANPDLRFMVDFWAGSYGSTDR